MNRVFFVTFFTTLFFSFFYSLSVVHTPPPQPETIVSPASSLTEAALLMQSRKSDADVDSIVEICPTLTPSQILKLLKSYTSDDCEDPISQNFIESLSRKLNAVSPMSRKIVHNSLIFIAVTLRY